MILTVIIGKQNTVGHAVVLYMSLQLQLWLQPEITMIIKNLSYYTSNNALLCLYNIVIVNFIYNHLLFLDRKLYCTEWVEFNR